MKGSETVHRIDSFFAEISGSFGTDFQRILDECKIPKRTKSFSALPVTRLHQLCRSLNLTLDTILRGQVDLTVLRKHCSGIEHLPDQYLKQCQYSSRFTAIYMLNFLRNELGADAVKSIQQRFQLGDSQFSDTALTNNILLPLDICQYVDNYFGEKMVERMGESSFELFVQTPVGEELRSIRKESDFFEAFIHEHLPNKIERNLEWKINRLTNGTVEFSGSPRLEVCELLRTSKRDTGSLEKLRKGFISSLPKLLGRNSSQVTQVRSRSQGDDQDTYLLEYEQSANELYFLQ